MKILGTFFAVLALVLVIGCSGDDKSPTGNNGGTQEPAFSIDSITVPDAMMQSTDPMAQQTVMYVMMANAFANYGTWFTPPTTAGNGPPWTYTWTVENLTVTLTIKEEGNNWVWDITWNGTDGVYTYNDWLFIHAEQAKDNSSGQLIIYEPVTTIVAWMWTWSVDAQGVYTLVMTSESDGSKIEVSVNPNDSGELKVYETINQNYVMTLKVIWQADGSGQWWTYDENGQTGSGSWS
jgi:copper(I)-binding protein